jgi:hypothetical protein
MSGYLDELRITKGVARTISSVPTEPFPRVKIVPDGEYPENNLKSNVALLSAGSTATASTILTSPYNFSPLNVINGDRTAAAWATTTTDGNGGGWHDNTNNTWPDWVEINFGQMRNISEIIVYSIQDNYTAPIEPDNFLTFTLYGLTNFAVQGWNGSTWVTLGTTVQNNLVKKSFTFDPFLTDRVRVEIYGASDGYSRIAEVEVFTTGVESSIQPALLLSLAYKTDPTVGSTRAIENEIRYGRAPNYSGFFKINGTTIADGAPYRARLFLYPQSAPSLCIGETMSDAETGEYEFLGIAPGNYIVSAIDITGRFHRMIFSMIAAVPM